MASTRGKFNLLFYRHPRAGSDWDVHLRSRLLKHGTPLAGTQLQSKGTVIVTRQNLHNGVCVADVLREASPSKHPSTRWPNG